MDKLTQYLVEPFIDKEVIEEGVNDPGIFKGIFLAGGPGSGKSYVASQLFGIPEKVNISASGLKMVNQDKELEILLKKYYGTVDLANMPVELFRQLADPSYKDYSGLRSFAKSLSMERLRIYTEGRLGVIIDGTGHRFKSIKDNKQKLMSIGYDTFMVFVNTSLEAALERNERRPRSVPEAIVEKSWKDVQKNMGYLQGLFGMDKFMVVQNDSYESYAQSQKRFNMLAKKGVGKFIKAPLGKTAKDWVKKQKEINKIGIKDLAKKAKMAESIKLPVEIGDTILMGKFKNKKVVVKSVDFNEKGDLLINGRPALKFRMVKETTLPSPSRKGVKKMKKKGVTSVPYGSGYNKVSEAQAVKGSKVAKFITGHNLTMKGKKYKEIEFETLGVDNSSKMIKLKIIAPKNLFGMETPVRFSTIRRGPFTKTDTGKKLKEQKEIKKVIGVFGGRFQPFHSGHLATYKWMKSKFDEVYITTSNLKQLPRHPMDFKEKARHMVKMGIPKNRIVQEKTPYVAKNLLKKFDANTTAVVYAIGGKDAGRLGGKYFQPYSKSKPMMGFEEHGYIITAPQSGTMSGTEMRSLLGNPKYDDSEKKKTFKKVFGYYDKGVYTMMTNKFKQLFETYTLSDELVQEYLMEASIASMGNLDDGPSTFHKDYNEYKKVSKEWIDSLYSDAGWVVLDYIIRDGAKNSIKNAYKSVALSYLDHGQEKGSSTAVNKYKKWMSGVLEPLGWNVVNWMGTEAAIDNIIGSLFTAGADGDSYDVSSIYEKINLDKEVDLLLEGGAYGHLNHPFDDKNLTFSDFKTLIINTLQGNLDKEGPVTEKTDGQNIMISWKNGKLVAARNKGHIKNFGANSLDLNGIKNMFAGRGDIEKAFVSAISDLQKALKGLSKKQKDKIFGEGKKFMSLEVIYPATSNVIPYDKSLLQFHGTIEYNSAGSPVGEDRGSARMLAGMIKQINQNIQKTYSITKPFITQLPKVKNFSEKQSYFLGKLNKLQSEYKMSDNDTLANYHQAYWMEYIYNGAKNTDYPNPPNDILMSLTKRWAFFDKSYKIPNIKKDLKEYPKFLDWVLTTDKMDHAKLQKQHIRDWEILFFELGAEILSNLDDFIAANPSKATQQIRKDLKKAISKVKKSKDTKVLNTLKTQLDRLNAIGGLKAVVPTEGITFVFKGKLYKYTGAFAPANQILGMLKFV